MFRINTLIGMLVSWTGLHLLLAPTAASEERISLGAGVELVVESDDTRDRLLATELEVSRKLVDMARSKLKQVSKMQAPNPGHTSSLALALIERTRVTLTILTLLESSIKEPPWVRRDELSLRVLLQAFEVDHTETALQKVEKDLPVNPLRLYGSREDHLEASVSLLSLQLEFARVRGTSPAELERLAGPLRDVKQRAKSLKNKIENAPDENRLELLARIKKCSLEAHGLVNTMRSLINQAWNLCSDGLPDTHKPTAIQAHVDDICSRIEGWLVEVDAKISEVLPKATKLRSLQIRKLALVRDVLRRTEIHLLTGIESHDGHSQTLEENLIAELELCKTAGERIARCRLHVERIANTARALEAQHRVGRASGYDLHRMQIQLVNGEIRLLREQSRRDESE